MKKDGNKCDTCGEFISLYDFEFGKATCKTDCGNHEIEAALALCHRLRDGAARMTADQFHQALHRVIRADRGYADQVRVQFQNNPAAFLAHRQPQSQSVELLRTLLEITAP